MNDIIINGYTGEIITVSQLRQEKYHDAMNEITSGAYEPGGPWCTLSDAERGAAMTEAKTGGAYAEADAMAERGYAVGHHGG